MASATIYILSFDEDLSLKSSLDLIHKLKDYRPNNNDKLVAFDVISLFPSILINDALTYVRRVFVIKINFSRGNQRIHVVN